jgi:hypothetical protein
MHDASAAATPSARLGDRLASARRERFVGRQAELSSVRAALLLPVPPYAVLHIHGPGGTGKTTLLRELARIAAECDRPVVTLDGRYIEPSPAAFRAALATASGRPVDDSVDPCLPARGVLLIDTWERIEGLDGWLREAFLPTLPADCLVVLAGRNVPAAGWHTDLDWSALTRMIRLENFAVEESATYLATRGVPEHEHAPLLRFTHGHPLALALVVAARERGADLAALARGDEPDVVRVLLGRLVETLPSARYRQVLDACVVARTTDAALLAAALDLPDPLEADALLDWLRGLPFIEQGPHGLFPHDIAREVLLADAHWRDDARLVALSRRIYRHLRGRVSEAHGATRQRLQFDALYTLRVSPYNSAYFDWAALEGVATEPATPADTPAIVAMVARHEGAASAELAAYWLERQPDAFTIFRDRDGQRFGFMAHLALHAVTAADIAVDPALSPALAMVRRYGPVEPDERMLYLRFWMHAEHYQAITAAINLTAVTLVSAWMNLPRLAWNFITMADAEFWTPHFTANNVPRLRGAEFEVGGRRFGVFAHDWRVETPLMWAAGDHVPMPFAADGGQPVALVPALSQPAFASAVRQALRDVLRPDRLATNPLVTAQAFAADPGAASPVLHLQALLRQAIDDLAVTPRDRKFHRALWHTYLQPAPTQEQAAELLGLPFNTYRYHLNGGISRVIDWLWQRAEQPPRSG